MLCDGVVIGVDGATMNDDSGRGMSAIPGMSFGKTFMGGISGRSGSGRSVRRLVHTINPERSTIPEPSTRGGGRRCAAAARRCAAAAATRRSCVCGGGGAPAAAEVRENLEAIGHKQRKAKRLRWASGFGRWSGRASVIDTEGSSTGRGPQGGAWACTFRTEHTSPEHSRGLSARSLVARVRQLRDSNDGGKPRSRRPSTNSVGSDGSRREPSVGSSTKLMMRPHALTKGDGSPLQDPDAAARAECLATREKEKKIACVQTRARRASRELGYGGPAAGVEAEAQRRAALLNMEQARMSSGVGAGRRRLKSDGDVPGSDLDDASLSIRTPPPAGRGSPELRGEAARCAAHLAGPALSPRPHGLQRGGSPGQGSQRAILAAMGVSPSNSPKLRAATRSNHWKRR